MSARSATPPPDAPLVSFSAQVLGVYCERGTDPALWAEPLNAISNAGFLIAGAVALRRHGGDRSVALLGVLAITIGIGSFLFHTLATRAAMIADVAPIQAFIAAYFFFAMRRLFGLGALAAALATLAFMAAAAFAPRLLADLAPAGEPWRGLSGYLGGLFGLVGVGLALLVREGAASRTGRALLAIAGLFAVSLVFRTMDRWVCSGLPTGTHLVWHVLNAVVLFALMEMLARARRDFGRISG
ncbi:hypothetical protein [Hansschlegelia zhihuaiae]|uniref:Ceramidase n=1 Tax=Hansschlegelia zhihuaiae TaxID=405005 RepID=A0A4Q0MJQ1_9HYPH|nr:hypothetical protein [Hansschlegelia zhihuaiae]RXF73947.1 hypothetical protein EK403_08240 [Hansschlegelia zhihuaiae]